MRKIKSALISVFYKDGLDEIVKKLHQLGVKIYSTGGTYTFIESLGIKAIPVESLTGYPSILGGRVKTLHPSVFGGILARRTNQEDQKHLAEYHIPEIDLVIVDLYPFEKTVESGAENQDIIEKIDIGGISLIRAAAKNYQDVLIVPSVNHYAELLQILNTQNGNTQLTDRKRFATYAFQVSSNYDTAIFNYFNQEENLPVFKQSKDQAHVLRYGENPHQKAIFYGSLDDCFKQLHGKEISYNNLLDIDAAINLIHDFSDTTFAIIKHNNACGLASRPALIEAWKDALAADPVSAFGGILVTNRKIDKATAEEINQLFFEVIIAPEYETESLDILKSKKNRIILQQKDIKFSPKMFKSVLNGVMEQDKDLVVDIPKNMQTVTQTSVSDNTKEDLMFANIIVKHTKSNAIVLVKNKQLIASGTGQTSRVDALRQAIEKAKSFHFDLQGAVMASDAFFPFADCVEIAHQAGVTAVIQPGGSVRDQDTIDYCNQHEIGMVFTGNRHFKH